MARSTTLRLPDPLKAEATAYADGLGVSLNALCAVALRDYLDARKPKPAALPAKVGPQAKAEPARASAALPGASGGSPMRPITKVGANQPCPCGSGQKFKRCHGKPGA
ncbi:SEC-C metal-binding domain-containing protein [Rhodanobacter lindaniclasticus]|uniref:Zinc chelation protein SecC n=1 Tax=Rhodanobacter lindaniclasticus TaxID=75310 RepID=A0A4S3KM10_9GAMM|nr:SEC-C metal-binding domain-containing protein [Rhodanobacter lindaniclasticus]THD09448.1 hypothetical protein B1991_02285 [Rhodanobacter lindaniclasticus]